MLSLIPRSDQAPVLLPAWHPDFRRADKLPDTKVVRTRFFINFASLAVAASLLLYFAYREYTMSKFDEQIADWQAKIDTNRQGSDQALAFSKKFGDEERKLAEFDTFLKPRVVLSQFLLHLGETLPPELTIDSVSVDDAGVSLRGFAIGKVEEASGRISPYVEQLRQDKVLAEFFGPATQGRIERDQAGGQLIFNLTLPFKGAARK